MTNKWAIPLILISVTTAWLIVANSDPACAGEPLCKEPGTTDLMLPTVSKLDSALSALQEFDPAYSSVFSVVTRFDARKTAEGISLVSNSTPYSATNGVSSLTTSANSFDQFLASLQAKKSTLTTEGKLAYLSQLGQMLSAGYNYDAKATEIASMEQLFKNLKANGTQGGVCRDIHEFLARSARALGFSDASTFSGIWQQSAQTANHQALTLRDPLTDEIYIQNYGQIINTHTKRLDEAIDIATQVLGPLTGLSEVQSRPGRVHSYQPRTARWVKQSIDSLAEFHDDRPMISLTASNRELNFGAELARRTPNGLSAKGFYLHSEYYSAEGPYKLDALGVSAEKRASKQLQDHVFDEVAMIYKAQLGYLTLKDPVLYRKAGASTSDSTQKRDNAFVGVNLANTARINQTTGKIELKMDMMDVGLPLFSNDKYGNVSLPHTEVSAGAKQGLPGKSHYVEINRVFELARKANTDPKSVRLNTSYDKINVVFDTRKPGETKAYLVLDQGIYLFEGAEKMSATALRTLIKGAIPTEHLGEFAIVVDMSKMTGNKSSDAYYDVPKSASVSFSWQKAVTKMLKVGVDVGYSNGNRPFFVFEQPGSITPELSSENKPEVHGNMWLRMHF